MIGGYAIHGKAKEAIGIFQSLLMSGLKTKFISFNSYELHVAMVTYG